LAAAGLSALSTRLPEARFPVSAEIHGIKRRQEDPMTGVSLRGLWLLRLFPGFVFLEDFSGLGGLSLPSLSPGLFYGWHF
jgi:hypothetical protein